MVCVDDADSAATASWTYCCSFFGIFLLCVIIQIVLLFTVYMAGPEETTSYCRSSAYYGRCY